MMILTARQEQNFFDKVIIIPGGCHEWTGSVNARGYGYFGVDGKTIGAHRIAFMLEYGREPKGMVLHSCDNPSCVNPTHLREGTGHDNAIDRSYRSPLNPKRKLTPGDVREIRHLLSLGYTQKEIGRRFDVAKQTIGKINRRSTWSHVS